MRDIFGKIGLPDELQNAGFTDNGAQNISLLLDNIVNLFFSAAAVAFILMFVWGVTQMILSGGDKEVVGKARSKITWAITGIVLMSLSYFIFSLLQAITGFKFFTD